MPLKYLLCPQCGLHRFFVRDAHGQPVFFHVGLDLLPFPTETSQADLGGLDFSLIYCCGCSWKGSPRKLVKIFTG